VADALPDGKYLLGTVFSGKDVGIYQISIAAREIVPLLPGMVTFIVRFARDRKSFLYPVVSRGEVTFCRQARSGGKLLGTRRVALKLAFALTSYYQGNAYDFFTDLSTVAYARPSVQADIHMMSHAP
jgi:hypothetical protein